MDKLKTAYFYSVMAVVITVPYFDHINSIFIGVLALFSVLSSSLSYKIKALKSNPWVLLFICFYLVQVVGYFNSESAKGALFILEKKGGMALLPLFLVTGTMLDSGSIKKLLLTFVASVLFGGLAMFFLSFIEFAETGKSSVFYYHNLANQLNAHAVYFSVAVSISLVILFQFKAYLEAKNQLLFYSPFFLLVLFLFLLSSKMILVVTLILLVIILFKNNTSLLSFSKIKLGIGILLIAAFALFNSNGIKKRFSEISFNKEVLNQEQYKYNTELNGLTLRLTIWKLIIEIIEEEKAPVFGIGTGDAQTHLQSKYKEKGLYTGNPEFKDRGYLDYNAHSQYFEELLRNGILGLAILLCLVFLPVYFTRKNIYSVAILLLFAFFFITESGLNRQAGNILFTLFVSLLLLKNSLVGKPQKA